MPSCGSRCELRPGRRVCVEPPRRACPRQDVVRVIFGLFRHASSPSLPRPQVGRLWLAHRRDGARLRPRVQPERRQEARFDRRAVRGQGQGAVHHAEGPPRRVPHPHPARRGGRAADGQGEADGAPAHRARRPSRARALGRRRGSAWHRGDGGRDHGRHLQRLHPRQHPERQAEPRELLARVRGEDLRGLPRPEDQALRHEGLRAGHQVADGEVTDRVPRGAGAGAAGGQGARRDPHARARQRVRGPCGVRRRAQHRDPQHHLGEVFVPGQVPPDPGREGRRGVGERSGEQGGRRRDRPRSTRSRGSATS